jgi:hypothetical protein
MTLQVSRHFVEFGQKPGEEWIDCSLCSLRPENHFLDISTTMLRSADLRRNGKTKVQPRLTGFDYGWVLPPICVPITSPETTISTRRFFCRPADVLLSATGLSMPRPCPDNESAFSP